MSHWNHRVIRHSSQLPNEDIEYRYSIHECYYRDGEDIPHSWTKDAIDVCGESLDELAVTLERMQRCLQKPVLHIVTDAQGEEHLEEL